MILRITIYYVLLVFMAFGERVYGLLSRIGLSNGPLILITLFFLYVALLIWEIDASIREQENYATARKRTSILSFFIGGSWGLMGTFSDGLHRVSPFLLIANFCIAGIMFGVLSLGINRSLFYRLTKLRNKVNTR
jgi:hypothetical protein